MHRLLAVVIFLGLCAPALAQPVMDLGPNPTPEQIQRAGSINGLALLANGEKMCGLTYKGEGMKRVIADKTIPNDAEYAGDLDKQTKTIAEGYAKWPQPYMAVLCKNLTNAARALTLIN